MECGVSVVARCISDVEVVLGVVFFARASDLSDKVPTWALNQQLRLCLDRIFGRCWFDNSAQVAMAAIVNAIGSALHSEGDVGRCMRVRVFRRFGTWLPDKPAIGSRHLLCPHPWAKRLVAPFADLQPPLPQLAAEARPSPGCHPSSKQPAACGARFRTPARPRGFGCVCGPSQRRASLRGARRRCAQLAP